jgi:hypothetical protein
MRLVTLISWLVTASLGAFMLRTWLARGGLRRERVRPGGLPPQLIFGHATLAISGLLVWAGYVASGAHALAWVAVGTLVLAVPLGLCTVTLWTPYPARRPGERRPAAGSGGMTEVVIPDTAAAAVEAVRAADARAERTDPDAPDVSGDLGAIEVTDELITRLLTEEPGGLRPGAIRPNPAVLVPLAHGFMAIATFVLAVMSAIT